MEFLWKMALTGDEVSRNRYILRKKNGIVLWGSEGCQITANQVKGCMLDGIYVENIGNAVIKSNRITNVNGRGIQVIASQDRKTLWKCGYWQQKMRFICKQVKDFRKQKEPSGE